MEHNFFIIYCSVNYIALLRVIVILHMTIVLPLRWISFNCKNLSKWEFGISDMPDAVDLMYKAFVKIQSNGKNIMDDTLMFGIFKNTATKVKPFEEYIEYMF